MTDEEIKSVPSTPTNDEVQVMATSLPFTIENKDSSREIQLECVEEDTQSSTTRSIPKRGEWVEKNDDKGQVTTDEERTRQERTSEDSEERRGRTPLVFTDKTQESERDQDLDQDPCPSRFVSEEKNFARRAESLDRKSDAERTQTEQEWELKSRKISLRARLVHAKTRVCSHVDDRTVRGEREFLKTIEKHKNQRLERLCICPVTKWLLFKERIMRLNIFFVRLQRCLWILCCPPLCYILPQVAFWPPPNEYFFYIDSGPPRIRKEVEGHKEAVEIAERKKKFAKVYRADNLLEQIYVQRLVSPLISSIGQASTCSSNVAGVAGSQHNFERIQPLLQGASTLVLPKAEFLLLLKTSEQLGWRIGHSHPCADDIDDVEGFVVRTQKNNVC
ncbi:hypothetical protein Y032_0235g3185 [Ancylostoma ceylanicum]|uniref:Uncharacterized protein n=1 Tax=Ancylostoma ceylanicum TaxID=53326 RepID=A0A016SEP0_9BILA|nr:hypothetical protein Y032_0235g3185 [Ancylostoma ceylanicum]